MAARPPMPPTDSTPCSLEDIVRLSGAPDLFVLRRVEQDRFTHIGGAGRGTGWAGIIDLVLSDEPHARAALRQREAIRVTSGLPRHVFGPYHARDALLVPVSPDVLVVFGSQTGQLTDGRLEQAVACAGRAEELVGEISPAKRLADELEVLHAVRATMQVPSPRLANVARHVTATAAEALSCEIAVLYLVADERLVVHDHAGRGGLARSALLPIMQQLARDDDALPTCTQHAGAAPLPHPLAPSDGVASYYALRIGEPHLRGLLLVCHLQEAARGFTTLCQELGLRVAEAADTVLHAAQLREGLERQVAAIERDALADPLTGLPNRRAFDAAMALAEQRRVEGAQTGIIVADLNGLKAANDARGHDFGDRMILTAADVLRSAVAGQGMLARLGGDEFVVLVQDVWMTHALSGRMEAAIAGAPDLDGVTLSAAVGLGTSSITDDVREALRQADKAMYAAKLRSGRGRLSRSVTLDGMTG